MGTDASTRLRLATGPTGDALLPTPSEETREEGREFGREEGREEGRELGREEGREEGRELGREEGRELGREEGRALARDLLEAQLTEKFGPLSPAHRAHLEHASLQQLRLYAERIRTAPSLEAILTDS